MGIHGLARIAFKFENWMPTIVFAETRFRLSFAKFFLKPIQKASKIKGYPLDFWSFEAAAQSKGGPLIVLFGFCSFFQTAALENNAKPFFARIDFIFENWMSTFELLENTISLYFAIFFHKTLPKTIKTQRVPPWIFETLKPPPKAGGGLWLFIEFV